MVWEYDESDPWDEDPLDEDIPEEPESEEPLAVEIPDNVEACDDLEQLVISEFLGERISPLQYQELMAEARAMLERHQEEQEAIDKLEYKDRMDLEFDSYDLHHRQLAERRAFEFKVLDINLGEAESEHDHLLDNLDNPEYEEKRLRLSRMYRKLSPAQREEFRKKVLDSGLMSEEMFDEMIEEELE